MTADLVQRLRTAQFRGMLEPADRAAIAEAADYIDNSVEATLRIRAEARLAAAERVVDIARTIIDVDLSPAVRAFDATKKAYSAQVDTNTPPARDVSTSPTSSKQTAETYNDSGDVKDSDDAKVYSRERGLAAMDAAGVAFSTLSDVEITETATNAIKEARGKPPDARSGKP